MKILVWFRISETDDCDADAGVPYLELYDGSSMYLSVDCGFEYLGKHIHINVSHVPIKPQDKDFYL